MPTARNAVAMLAKRRERGPASVMNVQNSVMITYSARNPVATVNARTMRVTTACGRTARGQERSSAGIAGAGDDGGVGMPRGDFVDLARICQGPGNGKTLAEGAVGAYGPGPGPQSTDVPSPR